MEKSLVLSEPPTNAHVLHEPDCASYYTFIPRTADDLALPNVEGPKTVVHICACEPIRAAANRKKET